MTAKHSTGMFIGRAAIGVLLGLVIFVGVMTPAFAQGGLSGGQAPAPSVSSSDQGPVRVPEPSELAMRHHRGGNALWVVDQCWAMVVPALLLFGGFSARMRNAARRVGRKWFFTIGIYVAIFFGITFLIDLPLSYYEGFVRPHAYGLSNQAFGKWFGDSLKEEMVNIVTGALFLWVPYLLLRKSPKRWWLYTGILVPFFLFFAFFTAPIVVDPLFNDFGPMKDKALESKILALAGRAGIDGGNVFEVEKSVDTKELNAYVTGLMDTKRIVLWDTIIAKFSEEELLFVVGHEMAHYVLGHVWALLVILSGFMLFALYAVYRVSDGLIRRYQHRFGFSELSDIASLPLIILLMNIITLVTLPCVMGYSRYQEHEADRFALELTHSNHAGAIAFVKLQEGNLENPRPGLLFTLWQGSHPSIGDRVDYCNTYRPWETGQPLRYGHYFK